MIDICLKYIIIFAAVVSRIKVWYNITCKKTKKARTSMEKFLPGLMLVGGIYLLLINVVGFAAMGIDKRRAKKDAWRIPEARLFLFAIIGGSIGSILGMRVFHHKTKHWYFKFGMPLILILQIALTIFLVVYFKK